MYYFFSLQGQPLDNLRLSHHTKVSLFYLSTLHGLTVWILKSVAKNSNSKIDEAT